MRVPGTRTKVSIKPGQDFQVFRGEIELDVFHEKGKWTIVTSKEVIILEEKEEQPREECCEKTKGRGNKELPGGVPVPRDKAMEV